MSVAVNPPSVQPVPGCPHGLENVRGGGELRPRVCVSVCLWPGPWSAAGRCGTPSLGLSERASPVWVPGPPCVCVFLPWSLSLSLTLILFPPLSVSLLMCVCVCFHLSLSLLLSVSPSGSRSPCLSLSLSFSMSSSPSWGFPNPSSLQPEGRD